jgi:hypothetical protein
MVVAVVPALIWLEVAVAVLSGVRTAKVISRAVASSRRRSSRNGGNSGVELNGDGILSVYAACVSSCRTRRLSLVGGVVSCRLSRRVTGTSFILSIVTRVLSTPRDSATASVSALFAAVDARSLLISPLNSTLAVIVTSQTLQAAGHILRTAVLPVQSNPLHMTQVNWSESTNAELSVHALIFVVVKDCDDTAERAADSTTT